ncbi:hypothetical protein TRL7639_01760 [Falsiruegeria litorea R37]|uniref:HNH nuclease domain-containing protein n=1 Tax=Falsiruegeria litorea R37 TaxID=1200284 RepID=A0A1Y5SAP3_9RHOB|nr:hypothetical protein [Falsiruegeria litorea]SLN36370.1 hypothetical protein TRL7639_01760 [Falsiruegeria litorea R37]
MRFVQRSNEVPETFEARAKAEYDDVVVHRNDPTKTKSFTFKTYKRPEIKQLLQDMFRGKCAYCETFYSAAQPMDVEHYRPKGAVSEDDSHEGYWWLAMKWDNLLPSCIDCNRKRKQITPVGDVRQVALIQNGTPDFSQGAVQSSGKKDSFPITDTGERVFDAPSGAKDNLAAVSGPGLLQEEPLLLNPCNDQPEDHLRHHFTSAVQDGAGNTPAPVSFMLPAKLPGDAEDTFRGDDDLSLKGAVSIHVYGLNRLDLVQARTELLRRLEFLKSVIIQLHALADEIEAATSTEPLVTVLLDKSGRKIRALADQITDEITVMARDEAPYSSMVQAWRKTFMDELAGPAA